MKKIAFILVLSCCSLGQAQQFVVVDKQKTETAKTEEAKKENKVVFSEKEYFALLNYTPKAFVADTKSKPDNQVIQGNLNSISSLELRYAYQQQLKLNAIEIAWFESEINKLAAAFFTEGKPIIIERTGAYGNCIGQGIETRIQNKQTITVLHFCYVCPGAGIFEDRFLEIFNAKTNSLVATRKIAVKKKPKGKSKKKTYKKPYKK